ncbi:MAG: hypothetical protein ACYTEX_11105 [Planctomycetota bacterium]|jgi:hypothetical protein
MSWLQKMNRRDAFMLGWIAALVVRYLGNLADLAPADTKILWGTFVAMVTICALWTLAWLVVMAWRSRWQ